MPISKAGLAAALCLGLSGCGQGFEFPGVARSAPDRMALADGTIVAGARGWCVDRENSRVQDNYSVVLLGSCASLTGNPLAAQPEVSGLLTVSVDANGGAVPALSELEAFFGTEAGHAALAHDGRADSVQILETRQVQDAVILHASDDSAIAATDQDIWRALFALGGHLTSVSLYGAPDRPIDPVDGLAALTAQIETLRAANAPDTNL